MKSVVSTSLGVEECELYRVPHIGMVHLCFERAVLHFDHGVNDAFSVDHHFYVF